MNMWLYFGITTVIALVFAVIYYIISQFVQSAQVVATAKNEMYSVISTVLIGVVIYALIAGGYLGASLMGASGTGTDAVWNVVNTSVSRQFDNVQMAYRDFYKGYFVLTKLTGFFYTATRGPPMYVTQFISGSPNVGLTPIVGQYSQIFGTLGQALMFLIGQLVLIKFFLYTAPKFIIPLGLLLRLLAPTRKLGSTILAVGVGVYFILPFAAMMTAEIYTAIPHSNPYPAIQSMEGKILSVIDLNAQPMGRVGTEFVCSPVMGVIAGLGVDGFTWVSCALSCLPSIAAYALCFGACTGSGIFQGIYLFLMPGYQLMMSMVVSGQFGGDFHLTPGEIDTIVTCLTEDILPTVSYQWLLAFLLPVINYIITIGIIKSLSSAIGGEGYIYALSKVL
jgi:hypothetical protein